MATEPITLTLVNDYQIVVEGLARMLEPFSDRVRVVGLAADEPSRVRVDIALYDTFAADAAFSPAVNAHHRVLWTISTGPDFTTAALTNGADGVLSKGMSPEELVDALERVCAGEVVIVEGAEHPVAHSDWPGRTAGLSEREAEVVALVCQGLSNEALADVLFLSINTVKSYIRSAYRKMGVSSRSNAVLWGLDHGFAKRPGAARQHPDLDEV
jgi:DNA-binding NarL/FixJ family response regulator